MAGHRLEDDTATLEERIDELQRVVSVLTYKLGRDFSTPLDYTPRSVPVLDAVIAQVRQDGRELTPGMFLALGGYLGETLARTYHGQWVDEDGQLCIRLDGLGHARYLHVFDWVERAFEHPRSQSLTDRLHALTGWHHSWDEPGDAGGTASA